jgi:flavorubredoxin
MYNSTKKMAETIAEGIQSEGIGVKLFNTSIDDVSDLITEIFKAKGVIGGSCTVNNSVLRSVAALLTEIKGHKFKNKYAAAFGSYGWSGEGAKVINSAFEETGMKIANEPLQVRYRADSEELTKCLELGKHFAQSIK